MTNHTSDENVTSPLAAASAEVSALQDAADAKIRLVPVSGKRTVGHLEAFTRTSDLVIRVKSFGNSAQHEQTMAKAMYELELRGFDAELLKTMHHDG